MYIPWHRPSVNDSSLLGVHLNAISAYNVAKKLQLRFVEFTLRQLGIEVMLSQLPGVQLLMESRQGDKIAHAKNADVATAPKL